MFKAHVAKKYGHSIELQIRKEMAMEIPEAPPKPEATSASTSQVSLK